MKSGEDVLQQLVNVFPFLLELPHEILHQLDTTEFYLPPVKYIPLIRNGEHILQAHIMLYRRGTPAEPCPGKIFLCRILAPASLPNPQLAFLLELEQRNLFAENVTWVAYAKPLIFRS